MESFQALAAISAPAALILAGLLGLSRLIETVAHAYCSVALTRAFTKRGDKAALKTILDRELDGIAGVKPARSQRRLSPVRSATRIGAPNA